MKKSLQLFATLAFSVLLSACVSDGYAPSSWSLPSWGNSTGVVTKDPNSVPNIAWQTENQRDVLSQQSEQIAKSAMSQTPPPAGSRPSLERVTGAAPIPVPAAPARKVKVALLLPLSGKNADLGQSMLKASQMALFDVGSSNFELVPVDTKSTPTGAADGARSALADQAELVLGPIFADDVKAAKPVTDAAGKPMIAFTTDWTLGGSNTYIMGFVPHAQVARIAQYAQSKGLSRLAVYAPQTPYCDVVISTLQRMGTPLVKVGRYSPMQSDLGTVVADFVASTRAGAGSSFDTLMLPVGGEGLRSLVSILDQKGLSPNSVKLIGTGLWDDASLTNDPSLYGSWFAAPDPALRRDFERRYQENYGAAPVRLSSLAYDATALAAVLARSSQGNDPYARNQLTNARGFAGIDGIFRFRPDGLSERGLAVLEIQSGKARVIDPAPTAFFASGT